MDLVSTEIVFQHVTEEEFHVKNKFHGGVGITN